MTSPSKNDACTCPSWWDCAKRGCHQDALERYSSAIHKPPVGWDYRAIEYPNGHIEQVSK